jgi:hypothetical protein
LPPDTNDHVQHVGKKPRVREARKIGYKFTEETMAKLKIGVDEFLNELEKIKFRDMFSRHGKAFVSFPDEIVYVQPSMVVPMLIFIIPHVPWDLKLIPIPRALLPKLVNLLKKKMQMRILESSMAPYSNHWFTVPKKSGTLRFIQDM